MDTQDQNSWENKRRKIKLNVEKSIEPKKIILEKANGIRSNIDQAVNQINDELDKLNVLDEFYNIQGSEIDIDPIFEGSVDFVVYNSQKDAQNWNSLARN